MANIAIIGSGMVGTATGEGLMQMGHRVIFYDIKADRVSALCAQGLNAVNDIDYAIKQSEISFVCVPTPYKDGIILSHICSAIKAISYVLKKKGQWHLVVIKSTVIPYTTENVVQPILERAGIEFGLCMNPEFLTEISTTWSDDIKFQRDFWNKDRIVIGEMDKKSGDVLEELYKPIGAPIFRTDLKSAEMSKYAANCMLATKISYWNEMYLVCKKANIDPELIATVTALDNRLGKYGTIHGKAFGGTCLVAGTKIRVCDKLVNIEDVNVGDNIYDGRGLTKVMGISNRISTKNVEILARGRILAGSADHIQFIVNEYGKLEERLLGDVRVNDYIFMPYQSSVDACVIFMGKRPSRKVRWWRDAFVPDKSFARLMGLYMAEGTMSKNRVGKAEYSILWYFGGEEEYLAIEVLQLLAKIGIQGTKKFVTSYGTYGISRCWRVRCRRRGLQEIMGKLNINGLARNKIIDMLPNGIAEAFIGGWLDGDGSYSGGTVAGHSESIELINTIDTMLINLGVNAVKKSDGKEVRISDRQHVERVCSWTKRLKYDASIYKNSTIYKSQTMHIVDGGWAVQVSRVREIGKQKVYSIETESRKYIANNILTHNCLPKDLAAFNSFAEPYIVTDLLGAVQDVNDYMAKEYGVRE